MEASGTTMTWRGADDLRQLLIPLDQLKHHPENPRRGDVELIAESLNHFGQLKPIVIHGYSGRSGNYVVAGNHTLRGAKENGWTHIAVVKPQMTDEQADQFLLMDNRSSDRATNDDPMLANILNRMMDAGTLQGTGYDPDDVDDLISSIGAVAEVPEQDFEGDYAESAEETAARYTTPGEGVRMKEALLMYPEAQFEEFTGYVKKLCVSWGVDGLRNAVFQAVKRAADEL